jgi:hypothetical protein
MVFDYQALLIHVMLDFYFLQPVTSQLCANRSTGAGGVNIQEELRKVNPGSSSLLPRFSYYGFRSHMQTEIT